MQEKVSEGQPPLEACKEENKPDSEEVAVLTPALRDLDFWAEKLVPICDTAFTPERQAKLLAASSVDSKGRPVRYFRYMSRDKLATLLENGNVSHLDYFKGKEFPADYEDQLKDFIVTYLVFRYRVATNADSHEQGDLRRSLEQMTIQELLQKSFPFTEAEELTRVFLSTETRNWHDITLFFKDNVDTSLMTNLHSGGRASGQIFSHLLSLSVGGPILDRPPTNYVYVEFALEDSRIQMRHPSMGKQATSEREVFVDELSLNDITRIYPDSRSIYDNITDNEETAPGAYFKAHPEEKGFVMLEHWRTEEAIVDTLPVGLRDRYLAGT